MRRKASFLKKFTAMARTNPSAEVIQPCRKLQQAIDFFTENGFRLDTIFPSDDPAVAVVSGHSISIRLARDFAGPAGEIRLPTADPQLVGTRLAAPNGTVLVFAPETPPFKVPAPSRETVISKVGDNAQWITGRAGMGYRDLVPSRLGGHIIASHILVEPAGPIADYVHYHKVHFQLIFCYKGWVKVVYEDNGDPITLTPGDCFLQPPEIRHRVLESSGNLEVVEVTCPSDHMTYLDHDMALPTPHNRPGRLYGGQKFVYHNAKAASPGKWRIDGFSARDLEINAATSGVGDVKVIRPTDPPQSVTTRHTCPMLFSFVMAGSLAIDGETLTAADAFVMPSEAPYTMSDFSPDLELLEVALPADFETVIL